MPPLSSSRRSFDGPIPFAATAITSGLAWLIKYALIDAHGGPLADDGPWIPSFYLLGLVTLFAAGALGAWAALRSHAWWLRIPGALVGAVLAFLLHRALDAIGKAALDPQGWQRTEVGIWLTAVVMVVAGALAAAVGLFGWPEGKKPIVAVRP